MIFLILVEFIKGSNRVFNNIPPELSNSRWSQLCNIGLITNKIRLIHSGTMHYLDYSGFDQELKIKLVNANFSTCYEDSSRLKFRTTPSTDQRKDIGLLMGTAIGIESLLTCSDVIRPANFRKITHNNRTKIADFQVIGPGLNQITFEVKGRQSASIEMARESCNQQLLIYRRPKYSFITKIIYNNQTSCRCFIDDPDEMFAKSDERTSLINSLMYYSNCMNWAGFYQFAERLLNRSKEIEEAGNEGYLFFNKNSLEEQLVSKIGYGITYTDHAYGAILRTFVSRINEFRIDNRGMFKTDRLHIGFYVTQNLIDTLIEQDFKKILEFKENELIVENKNVSLDIRQDGTVLLIQEN